MDVRTEEKMLALLQVKNEWMAVAANRALSTQKRSHALDMVNHLYREMWQLQAARIS